MIGSAERDRTRRNHTAKRHKLRGLLRREVVVADQQQRLTSVGQLGSQRDALDIVQWVDGARQVDEKGLRHRPHRRPGQRGPHEHILGIADADPVDTGLNVGAVATLDGQEVLVVKCHQVRQAVVAIRSRTDLVDRIRVLRCRRPGFDIESGDPGQRAGGFGRPVPVVVAGALHRRPQVPPARRQGEPLEPSVLPGSRETRRHVQHRRQCELADVAAVQVGDTNRRIEQHRSGGIIGDPLPLAGPVQPLPAPVDGDALGVRWHHRRTRIDVQRPERSTVRTQPGMRRHELDPVDAVVGQGDPRGVEACRVLRGAVVADDVVQPAFGVVAQPRQAADHRPVERHAAFEPYLAQIRGPVGDRRRVANPAGGEHHSARQCHRTEHAH